MFLKIDLKPYAGTSSNVVRVYLLDGFVEASEASGKYVLADPETMQCTIEVQPSQGYTIVPVTVYGEDGGPELLETGIPLRIFTSAAGKPAGFYPIRYYHGDTGIIGITSDKIQSDIHAYINSVYTLPDFSRDVTPISFVHKGEVYHSYATTTSYGLYANYITTLRSNAIRGYSVKSDSKFLRMCYDTEALEPLLGLKEIRDLQLAPNTLTDSLSVSAGSITYTGSSSLYYANVYQISDGVYRTTFSGTGGLYFFFKEV